MRNYLMIGCLAILAFACSDPKMEKVDELQTEAIRIHDIVMPRIGEINALQSSINKVLKEAANDSADLAQMKPGALDRISELESAYNGMMNWMDVYKISYEADHPVDEAIAYYEDQVQQISVVKTDMETSIEDAEKWIEAHSSAQ